MDAAIADGDCAAAFLHDAVFGLDFFEEVGDFCGEVGNCFFLVVSDLFRYYYLGDVYHLGRIALVRRRRLRPWPCYFNIK